MSGKINVWAVIAGHFNTLRNHGGNHVSAVDYTIFVICPMIIAGVVFCAALPLNSSLVSALINASAILLGLLLNLLVLMFDQRSKTDDLMSELNAKPSPPAKRLERLSLRCEVIDQSVANISFTVLLCIGSLVSLLIFSIRADTADVDLFERVMFSWNSFVWINVSLTILMIIKRVYLLFKSAAN